MQNAEEWKPSCYIRDVAEEIATYVFNKGQYPKINYVSGDIGPDTPITTDENGSLTVYVPQDINIDQGQWMNTINQALKNGSMLAYGQSWCKVQVAPCPNMTKEKLQQEVKKLNNTHDTEYYRLILGPDNSSFYLMSCTAQAQEIKQQIQRQFEQGNSYYYQTDAGEVNSSESLSKEDIYLTALKMFALTGIMTDFPEPDQDDEEQKKLYCVCMVLNNDTTNCQYNRQSICNMINQQIDTKDIDDTLKEYCKAIAPQVQYVVPAQTSVVPQVQYVVPSAAQESQNLVYQAPPVVPAEYVVPAGAPVVPVKQLQQNVMYQNVLPAQTYMPQTQYIAPKPNTMNQTNVQYFTINNASNAQGIYDYDTQSVIANHNNYNNMVNGNNIITTVNNNNNTVDLGSLNEIGYRSTIKEINNNNSANSPETITEQYQTTYSL